MNREIKRLLEKRVNDTSKHNVLIPDVLDGNIEYYTNDIDYRFIAMHINTTLNDVDDIDENINTMCAIITKKVNLLMGKCDLEVELEGILTKACCYLVTLACLLNHNVLLDKRIGISKDSCDGDYNIYSNDIVFTSMQYVSLLVGELVIKNYSEYRSLDGAYAIGYYNTILNKIWHLFNSVENIPLFRQQYYVDKHIELSGIMKGYLNYIKTGEGSNLEHNMSDDLRVILSENEYIETKVDLVYGSEINSARRNVVVNFIEANRMLVRYAMQGIVTRVVSGDHADSIKSEFNGLKKSLELDGKLIKEHMKENKRLKESLDVKESENKRLVYEIRDLREDISSNKEVKELKSEKQSIIKENKRLTKLKIKFESRNNSLEEKVKEKDREIHNLRRLLESQTDRGNKLEGILNLERVDDKVSNIDELIAKLKDKKIVIAGGLNGLRDRLSEVLPNIEMIPYEEIGRIPQIAGADIVGIYYKAISHPDRWSVESQLRNSNIPIAYIGNSNIASILKELSCGLK